MTSPYKTNFLPEFQNYLHQRGLVLEKHIPFFARWAHLYLAFLGQVRGDALPFEIGLERFLKHTSVQENCQGWQVSQAEEAVRLFAAFRGEEKGSVVLIPADVDTLAEKFKERMRLNLKT